MTYKKIRKEAVLTGDTPPARLSWSSLFEKVGTKFSSDNLRYRATFFFPRKSEKLIDNFPKEWVEAYSAVVRQAYPDGKIPDTFQAPWVDGREKDRDWCRDWVWVKATSGYEPKVFVNEKVMKNGQACWRQIGPDEADEVYEGCWVLPKVAFNFYNLKTPGVNVYFKSLIRVLHDDRWGGGDFDELDIPQENPAEALEAQEVDGDVPF